MQWSFHLWLHRAFYHGIHDGDIVEIKKPDLDAKLVGEGIARQLEARIAFRRATRQATQRSMRSGAKGIKVQTAGRLNGADRDGNHLG